MENGTELKKNKKYDFGIVTFFAKNNYGAVLQAYALQQKILKKGYTTEIINYQDSEKTVSNGKRNRLKSYFNALKAIDFNVKLFLGGKQMQEKTAQKFDAFRKERMIISRCRAYDMEDLEELGKSYKAVVAGSDMVWTLKGQNMDVFFLRFIEKEKRLSYAASMTGTNALTATEKERFKIYISEMESVSCREQEGVDFAREANVDAFLALDPTLLMTRDEWMETLSLQKRKEDYILCYCFGTTPSAELKRIEKLAKKKGLSVRYIGTSLEKMTRELKNGYYGGCGPKDFVELFFNAKFVVTNTFHGLIFSLIGKKPFALLRREDRNVWKKNEGRMENMLRMIGEERRYIESVGEVDESFFSADYEKIDTILAEKRQASMEYLENMLKKADGREQKAVKKIKPVTVEDISVKKCTGCTACASVCANGCIEMEGDSEGFLHPVVDHKICTSCGLCVKVCPAINENVGQAYPNVGYLAFSKDAISKNSASGGAFITLAQYAIEKLGGVVYGCAMEENSLKCIHKRAEKTKDLYPMQNSKYVQSDVSNCFRQAEKDLEQGRFVLFSGTPCQIAGLKSFLKSEYKNLLTVDIICHGVPSPELWNKKVEYMRKTHGDVKYYTFRNKDNEATLRSAFESTVVCEKKRIKKKSWEDGYFKAFLTGKTYRMSCYYCKYADIYRCGDITLGDCDSWRDYPGFFPQKAKSSVLINTSKGAEFWERTKQLFELTELNVEGERRINKQLSSPTPMPSCRKTIYQEAGTMEWKDFDEKYSVKTNKLKSFVARVLYKFLH